MYISESGITMTDYDIYAYTGVAGSITLLVVLLYVLLLEAIAYFRVKSDTPVVTRRQVFFKFYADWSWIAVLASLGAIFYDSAEHVLFKFDGPFNVTNYGYQSHWLGYLVVTWMAVTYYMMYAFKWVTEIPGAAKPRANTQVLGLLGWISSTTITALYVTAFVYACKHMNDEVDCSFCNGSINVLVLQALAPLGLTGIWFIFIFDSLRQMNVDAAKRVSFSKFQFHEILHFMSIAAVGGVEAAIATQYQGFDQHIAVTDTFSSNGLLKFMFVTEVLVLWIDLLTIYDRFCVLTAKFGHRSLIGKPREKGFKVDYSAVAQDSGMNTAKVADPSFATTLMTSVGIVSRLFKQGMGTGRPADEVTYTYTQTQ